MDAISSFRDVVGLWKTPDDMATEIGASVAAARKWPQRDNIPPEWWASVVASATGTEAGLTAELLMQLAARRAASASSEMEART